jgi:predicted DNA-binding transcriptional regulator AlpA
MLKTRAGDIIGNIPGRATVLLRFADLKERGIVNTRQTLLDWIKRYGFPPGRWLAPNTRAWTEEEIEAWLANRPSAAKEA